MNNVHDHDEEEGVHYFRIILTIFACLFQLLRFNEVFHLLLLCILGCGLSERIASVEMLNNQKEESHFKL